LENFSQQYFNSIQEMLHLRKLRFSMTAPAIHHFFAIGALIQLSGIPKASVKAKAFFLTSQQSWLTSLRMALDLTPSI
jgi:hypothetical protein